MKKILGLILIAVGIGAGVYFGFWWAFVGGIVAVIEAIKIDPVSASGIAFGVLRWTFSWVIGIVAGLVLVGPGVAMVESARNDTRLRLRRG